MVFDTLDEAIAYIKSAVADCMNPIGDNMEEIMKKAIQSDIYSDHGNTTGTRTMQLIETPTTTHTDNNSVEVEYMDTGDWSSVITGKHFFPLEGFLSGSVWSPGDGYYSADPTTTAFNECQEKIPNELADLLRSAGIPIE